MVLYKNPGRRPKQPANRQQKATRPRMDNLRPPQYMANPYYTRRSRFQISATGSYNVTVQNIMQSLGCLYRLSTAAATVNTAFRLRRLRMWGAAIVGGAFTPSASTVSVTWFGDQTLNFESNKEVSDSSPSSAYVAHIDATPPPRSSAAQWQAVASTASVSTAVFMLITGMAEAVIDVDFDIVHGDGANSPCFGFTTAGGTVGQMFYPPLDGVGGFLTQVGLSNT